MIQYSSALGNCEVPLEKFGVKFYNNSCKVCVHSAKHANA